MPNKTIVQVPVTRAEIYQVSFRQLLDTWTAYIDYQTKDDVGNDIVRRTAALTPGAAGQTQIKDIINTCVTKANQQEGT